MTEIVLKVLLLILVNLCAVTDLLYGKIPNLIVMPIGAIAVILHIFSGGFGSIIRPLAQDGIVNLILFLIWKITGGKGIGAGDIKMLFSVSLLADSEAILSIWLVSFLSAGIYGLFKIYWNHLNEQKMNNIRLGPFIALASDLYLAGFY